MVERCLRRKENIKMVSFS
uniref:Uncharacterized protein n=1 Tax=Rhizophora mucronata TaxID=61149 RepID=A0A2P2QII7_RHIMU